jgi:hypothetical protein
MSDPRGISLRNPGVPGRACALLLALVGILATPARATVIVQDTFEGPGCSESTFWRFDSRPNFYCLGGTGNCATAPYGPGCSCLLNSECDSGNCYDEPNTRGPEVGTARNGISPPPGGGSCYTYKHYHQDEDAAYLYSSDELNPNYWVNMASPNPYQATSSAAWPAGTKSSTSWHYVYYIYVDSQHSGVDAPPGSAGTFAHPGHQKLGKWYLTNTWTPADASCSNPQNIVNLGHLRGTAGGGTGQPMNWMSFMEAAGTVASGCSNGNSEPPNPYNLDFGNGVLLTWDTWHKVEAYVNNRGTCTGGAASNAGCTDQMRVWVDGVLAVNTDTGNFAGGTVAPNIRVLSKFWFFGNSSASGAAVNYWIYADNFCVGTSYNDCTGAPFNGTLAQAEFGGKTTDTTPPATISDLAASGATSSSMNLTWTAPGDDGTTGQATSYDIRYRTDAPLTASNWGTASQVTNDPTPKPAGQAESFTVTGLSASTTYYFGIKTSDEVPNTSGVSNSPSAATTAASSSGVTYLSDGFESGNLNNWTDDDGGFTGMAVTTSGPHAGTYANMQSFNAGDTGTYGAVFFADHPLLHPPDPQWTGVQETDVSLQWAAKFSPGFNPSSGSTKMFIMASFESWTAPYPGPNSWAPYYTILQIDSSGRPFLDHNRKVGTPGWMEMDQNQGTAVSITDGAWHVLKAHLKLNTPGAADGIGEMWIDGVLKVRYTNVDFRGSYTANGWNHLVLSSNMPAGAPQAQQEYWDDVLLTGGAASTNTTPPATPQNLIRTDKH